MCNFFSFITVPGEGKKYYFDWRQRQERNFEDCDRHSVIAEHYKITNENINAYEYNPLTKELEVDCRHGIDDSKEVRDWLDGLDWKTIVEPLIVKPILNPFDLPKVKRVTDEQVEWLKEWASVWDSVRDSVLDSVLDSVGAYTSSFFEIDYEHDFSPVVKLWEAGLVPSFDGKTWRLHSGKDAIVVCEIKEGQK